ncbi:uncharacterized protein LOC143465152 [Clavelina lepadiformis]|uniref:uncharacterized protein LOC143465152 n=1 Tax=Clavelina lepadiformis TaxID=159417 RepID=UPI0040413F98
MTLVRILAIFLLLAVFAVSADFDCYKCKYSGGKCVTKTSYKCIYKKKSHDYCYGKCHKHATCKRSYWRYKCECNHGYHGNGHYCNDYCHGRCHKDAKCVRSHYGQYKCECNSGYSGHGHDCKSPCGYCPKHSKCVANKKQECKCGYGYEQYGKYCQRKKRGYGNGYGRRNRYPW